MLRAQVLLLVTFKSNRLLDLDFVVISFTNLSLVSEFIKSNLHYTGHITPKRVTSGGAHLRCLAPGQHHSEKPSKRVRAVGDAVSDLTCQGIEPRPPALLVVSPATAPSGR